MAVLKQTYDNTYFFSRGDEMEKHHKHLTGFILKANRIENKADDNFRGVIEDVKRYQRSSVLYTILTRPDVVIAFSDVELPAAFKVFAAKDLRNGNMQKKVFIDATGLITNKNGYWICNDIAKFTTRLTQAMVWLLYENATAQFLNNSNVTTSALECFVALVDYIIGYFRFYGFSENRNKISYISAMYFLMRIMGKDDDQYTRNLAAKVAGVQPANTKAFSLYYDSEKDFKTIDTFINMLAESFKLKGLTTEVFVARWSYLFGAGTQYAVELFPAFCSMMMAAYCGTYVVNQKTIESQTKTSMVKLGTSIQALASSEFDRKVFMKESDLDEFIPKDKNSALLAESIARRDKMNDDAKLNKEVFKSTVVTTSHAKSLVNYYKSTKQEKKISDKLTTAIKSALNCMDKKSISDNYDDGVVTALIKVGKPYFTDKDKNTIINTIDSAIKTQRGCIEDSRDSENKELTKKLSKQIDELIKCKNM